MLIQRTHSTIVYFIHFYRPLLIYINAYPSALSCYIVRSAAGLQTFFFLLMEITLTVSDIYAYNTGFGFMTFW